MYNLPNVFWKCVIYFPDIILNDPPGLFEEEPERATPLPEKYQMTYGSEPKRKLKKSEQGVTDK